MKLAEARDLLELVQRDCDHVVVNVFCPAEYTYEMLSTCVRCGKDMGCGIGNPANVLSPAEMCDLRIIEDEKTFRAKAHDWRTIVGLPRLGRPTLPEKWL